MKKPCEKCKMLLLCSIYGGDWCMRKLFNKVTQLFCKHQYEREYIKGGFWVKDGWLVQPYHLRCQKCGKVRKDK